MKYFMTTLLADMLSAIIPILLFANVCQSAIYIDFNANGFGSLRDRAISTIVKGSVPWRFQFSYVVDLRVYVGNSVYSCGASLISQNYVLTAAHCYYGYNADKMTLRFGGDRLPLPVEFGRYQMEIPLKNIKIHESYNPKTFVNDIAIIKLPKPAYLSVYVQVVKLPARNQSITKQTSGTVAGWGRTGFNSGASSRLLYTDMEILTFDECKKFYTKFNGLTLDEKQMCASGYLTGGTTCTGDSGGPLVLKDKIPPLQVGIVSAGGSLCEPLVPTIFTNVIRYLGWIQNNTDVAIE